MSSCVVVPRSEDETGVVRQRSGPQGANQKAILAAFVEFVAQRKTRQALSAEGDWPGGVPFDEAVDALKDKLAAVDQHHRKIRTKEALEALVRLGHLDFDDDLLSLADNKGTQGGCP